MLISIRWDKQFIQNVVSYCSCELHFPSKVIWIFNDRLIRIINCKCIYASVRLKTQTVLRRKLILESTWIDRQDAYKITLFILSSNQFVSKLQSVSISRYKTTLMCHLTPNQNSKSIILKEDVVIDIEPGMQNEVNRSTHSFLPFLISFIFNSFISVAGKHNKMMYQLRLKLKKLFTLLILILKDFVCIIGTSIDLFKRRLYRLVRCFMITGKTRVKRQKLTNEDFELPESQKLAKYDPERVASYWNNRNVSNPLWKRILYLFLHGIIVKLRKIWRQNSSEI